ncbi:MAG: BrnA antitoxin family protein [Methylobacter sp.]
MSESKHVLGSDLKKIDAHAIQPDEYEEIPELTDEFFEQADLHVGGGLVQRGRPKSDTRKVLLSVRYSPEVVEYFRATGAGWQTRMDDALKEWLREHAA